MKQLEDENAKLKKTHRIYTELVVQLRNKTPKGRVKAKLREIVAQLPHPMRSVRP
jgi:hypothetical protein